MPCESPALNKQLAITVPDARAGRKGAGGDPGPGRRPGSGAARAPAGRAALPRAAGFWLVAGVLFLLLFVSGAASPLYDVYQAQWRFSATTLTAVFAVYALTLLATLLVFGSLSDYLGRRRVITVALILGAGACGLSAGRTDRRHLDRLLPGVQRPRGGGRGGHHALRPAPDRRGLLRSARRARRGGRGQLPVPQTIPARGPAQRRHKQARTADTEGRGR